MASGRSLSFRGGAAFIPGVLLAAHFLGGCLFGGAGECATERVPPVNVSATAGNGSATVTWEIPPHDTTRLHSVASMVLYAESGGPGEQCAQANVNYVPEGCIRAACGTASATQCTVTGLQNGVAYAFTVVTTAYPHNPYDCAVEAFARSEAVTPGAN